MNTLTIRIAERDDLPLLFLYLDDHLQDNGRNGMPLFQPMSRADSRFTPEKAALFANGQDIAVGERGWRRVWIALDPAGNIVGHVDLRGRPERAAWHRALLGMGVHRHYRRQGLGHELIETAFAWARTQRFLEWIDLEVLSVNHGARRLYERLGFVTVGEVPDMFHIDGEQHGYVFMAKKLR